MGQIVVSKSRESCRTGSCQYLAVRVNVANLFRVLTVLFSKLHSLLMKLFVDILFYCLTACVDENTVLERFFLPQWEGLQ